MVYAIETSLKIHQERIEDERKLDRLLPLDPDERKARRLELARAEQFPLAAHVSQELHQTIGAVVTAARRQPQLIPEDLSPIALKPAERHELLVTMLIENPDQPQATFVRECRVPPNTVRRTRQAPCCGAVSTQPTSAASSGMAAWTSSRPDGRPANSLYRASSSF